MALIEVKGLKKNYGNGRGLFGIDLEIQQGETYGFVGINGAGKTTAIRHMMGFLHSQEGKCTIKDLDCWSESEQINRFVGYVPGEIAFPDAPNGIEFLKRQADLRGLKSMKRANELIDILQLDPSAGLKRMSKGMKQKTAIVAGFMHDPEILILDEPSTGLDPLMRKDFIDILNQEKAKGKTIFMSTHMFDEVEDTCDAVALIDSGKILATKDVNEIRHNPNKVYIAGFATANEMHKFLADSAKLPWITADEFSSKLNQLRIAYQDENTNKFTGMMKNYQITQVSEQRASLEEYFKEFYKKGENHGE